MARVAMAKSKSAEITIASRVGIGLIIIGGGRKVEAMRTHGVASDTVAKIFRSFVKAVNSCAEIFGPYSVKIWKYLEIF